MGWRLLLCSITLLLASLLGVPHTTVAKLLPIFDPNVTVTKSYIVHVVQPPSGPTNLLSDREVEEWHKSFLPNVTLDSGEPRLLYSYRYAISGFAARLTRDELRTIEAMDGFLLAYPVQRYQPLTTYTPEFLKLTDNSDDAWRRSNYGEGVIIGVIDSGVVNGHPSFTDPNGLMPSPPARWGGCCNFNGTCVTSACNNKLIGARTALRGINNVSDPSGHGSHCAAIATGNYVANASVLGQAKGTAVGMAPRAHLAVYQACIPSQCTSAAVAKAIDDAISDGVDIISMSLGPGGRAPPFHRDVFMKSTLAALAQRNILSVCAAGNSGPDASTIINAAPWVLTVGASTIDRITSAIVKLDNGMEFQGDSSYQPRNIFLPTDPVIPIAFPGLNGTFEQLTCTDELDNLNLTGKLVICSIEGGVALWRSEYIAETNATGLIDISLKKWVHTTMADVPYVQPASRISSFDSEELIRYFNNTPDPRGTIVFEGTVFNTRRAPAVAAFSSRGPSTVNGGIIKPDVIAPGVDILSAYHKEVGPGGGAPSTTAFEFQSGTSMATPHVAGVAALVKSAHPNWTAAEIKSAIVTTAYTEDRDGRPISDEGSRNRAPASDTAMGAGHVDPPRALDPGLIFDISMDEYYGYLCGLNYTDRQIRAMSQNQTLSCAQLTSITADQLNFPTMVVNLRGRVPPDDSSMGGVFCSRRTITRTVKNVGEPKCSYTARIKKLPGIIVRVRPRKLCFQRLNQKKSFTVNFIKCRPAKKGTSLQGKIAWVSKKRTVNCPMTVNF